MESTFIILTQIITFGTGLSPTYMDQGWDYVFRAYF